MKEEFGYVQFPPGLSLEEVQQYQARFNELVRQSGMKFVPFRQQIMLNAEPITITPPALFTDEMLEQLRAVVREELQVALGEKDDTSTDASLVSGTIARDGKLTDLGKSIVSKVRPLVKMPAFSMPAVKYVEFEPGCDEAIEGHPSITTELEHWGKLYKGVLYFVKDVE